MSEMEMLMCSKLMASLMASEMALMPQLLPLP